MTTPQSILRNMLGCLALCKEDERAFYLSCLYKHLSEHPELMGEDTQAQQVADETGERYEDVMGVLTEAELEEAVLMMHRADQGDSWVGIIDGYTVEITEDTDMESIAKHLDALITSRSMTFDEFAEVYGEVIKAQSQTDTYQMRCDGPVLYGWYPVDYDRIKEPERIPEYIKEGWLRKV